MLIQADLGNREPTAVTAAANALSAGRSLPLSQAYCQPAGLYDEMFTASGEIRSHCSAPLQPLLEMAPRQLATLGSAAERMLLERGVTFNLYRDGAGLERIFP